MILGETIRLAVSALGVLLYASSFFLPAVRTNEIVDRPVELPRSDRFAESIKRRRAGLSLAYGSGLVTRTGQHQKPQVCFVVHVKLFRSLAPSP